MVGLQMALLLVLCCLLAAVAAVEQCATHWDLRGAIFHHSYPCPQFCCGTAHHRFCCADPAQRFNSQDKVTFGVWFMLFGLMSIALLVVAVAIYACYMFAASPANKSAKGGKITPSEATSITHVSVHGCPHEVLKSSFPAVISAATLAPPDYSEPSSCPPPYLKSVAA